MNLSLWQEPPKIRCFMLTQAKVVARGVLFAGIVWEVEPGPRPKSRVKECIIIWFAMFSFYDLVFDLMEVAP